MALASGLTRMITPCKVNHKWLVKWIAVLVQFGMISVAYLCHGMQLLYKTTHYLVSCMRSYDKTHVARSDCNIPMTECMKINGCLTSMGSSLR